ncbi:MAG: glycoside hydrolase family 88 protein [Bacteroidales bacterium]|nr:glycoside hydrolase family 88 protein [Bacteroidales bacterium]MBN2817520.1 glycoside hydrolase family 88 protein [Bacteroidales bacterium]
MFFRRKKIISTVLFFLILGVSCNSGAKKKQVDAYSEKPYSVQMGETVLSQYPDLWSIEEADKPRWTYTFGLVSAAMVKLYDATGDLRYYNYAKSYIDTLLDENGQIKTYKKTDYNIDMINSGKLLFIFYEDTKDFRYKTALDTLHKQLEEHPQTEIGGYWHKKRYPHQMWLDGLYMGGPFIAQYAKVFNNSEDFNKVTRWYINMEKVARDPETGLLYHAWDESREQAWSDKETGCAPNFWGRGMGWYGMALVDLLDYLPSEHPNYTEIVAIIQRMAVAITKVQDKETGIWYQVLDQEVRAGNYLEGSVSSMFSYFLLKAVNKGYIDADTYKPVAFKAFEGTVKNLIKKTDDGTLVITPVCAVAGLGGDPYRDGSFDYYINEKRRDNDPKAVGPFIMAALEYEKLRN